MKMTASTSGLLKNTRKKRTIEKYSNTSASIRQRTVNKSPSVVHYQSNMKVLKPNMQPNRKVSSLLRSTSKKAKVRDASKSDVSETAVSLNQEGKIKMTTSIEFPTPSRKMQSPLRGRIGSSNNKAFDITATDTTSQTISEMQTPDLE